MRDKNKEDRKATKHTNFPVFNSTEDVPVHTSVSNLFFMYINKNTFIQVILEQFFFSFFVHKNYKKLQKAPLNRPVATLSVGSSLTQSRSPPQNSYLIYLF